ncbi:MAG: branched-chain amino acid transporter, permease component [Frankiales bacterium]|nr:branched-chain amino acid transporter, permease component [Frankiales bacterium]
MLELRGLKAGYGDTEVLRGVDLTVPDGAVVALLGPNGAGKTTLLRAASCLIRPTAGSLLVDGADATGWPAHRIAKAGVGHVPEGRGVFRSLTVRQNLRLQATTIPLEEALEKAADAFPILGQRMDQVAGTMSGGQQQMLALARGYVESPRYLLLDEVSMGLAPIVVDEIFAFLRRLADQGVGLLLVEQYVTRALELADLVFVLNKGEVAFAGEPSELDSGALFEQYLGVTA